MNAGVAATAHRPLDRLVDGLYLRARGDVLGDGDHSSEVEPTDETGRRAGAAVAGDDHLTGQLRQRQPADDLACVPHLATCGSPDRRLTGPLLRVLDRHDGSLDVPDRDGPGDGLRHHDPAHHREEQR